MPRRSKIWARPAAASGRLPPVRPAAATPTARPADPGPGTAARTATGLPAHPAAEMRPRRSQGPHPLALATSSGTPPFRTPTRRRPGVAARAVGPEAARPPALRRAPAENQRCATGRVQGTAGPDCVGSRGDHEHRRPTTDRPPGRGVDRGRRARRRRADLSEQRHQGDRVDRGAHRGRAVQPDGAAGNARPALDPADQSRSRVGGLALRGRRDGRRPHGDRSRRRHRQVPMVLRPGEPAVVPSAPATTTRWGWTAAARSAG